MDSRHTDKKGAVNDGTYNFNKMIGENPVFKEVHLHKYLSRSGYFSFNKGQFDILTIFHFQPIFIKIQKLNVLSIHIMV